MYLKNAVRARNQTQVYLGGTQELVLPEATLRRQARELEPQVELHSHDAPAMCPFGKWATYPL